MRNGILDITQAKSRIRPNASESSPKRSSFLSATRRINMNEYPQGKTTFSVEGGDYHVCNNTNMAISPER